jgi:hypothetical protein
MGSARTTTGAIAAAAMALAVTAPMATAGARHHPHDDGDTLRTVVDDLHGPRGVDALGHGLTLVTENDGTFSLVIEKGHRYGHHRYSEPKEIQLGQVPADFAPAIAAGRHGTVWLLTGATDNEDVIGGAAKLYKWRPGWDEPVVFADIAAYQKTDPDPYDLEDFPEDSNPFGLAALRDGSVLVSDAAGNDLLHVFKDGSIETVARLKPREVTVPEGLEGAGTQVMAEAVATSVTVGKDGSWYVGELRGFPGTAGTSEIWRVRPGTTDATCDPEHPWGECKRYADGLTSIVDLGAGYRGVYAVTLSKLTWLAIESPEPVPGAEIGGLFLVSRGHHHGWGHRGHGHDARITELVPDQLVLPGGVDVDDRGTPYVVGPVFGDGSLYKIR